MNLEFASWASDSRGGLEKRERMSVRAQRVIEFDETISGYTTSEFRSMVELLNC